MVFPMTHLEELRAARLTQGVTYAAAYRPVIFHPRRDLDTAPLSALLHDAHVTVFDTFAMQLRELIAIRHPNEHWSKPTLDAAVEASLGDSQPAFCGVWVYYPWSRRLVHTLDEVDFMQVRTNRNIYKITPEEQRRLAGKRIGVIGLSVGHAIALTLAAERSCGALRLADFDVLELTNLNRVRTGIHNLGVPKVIAAAREIAELDPFLQVTCFPEGITEATIDSFLTEHGRLDVLVEECDSLDIKILARTKAKQLGMPVLMHTSDRGMVDIERFDREPQRSLLHGVIDHLGTTDLKNLTTEAKIPYILAMLGIDTVSQRIKASMLEVEQTISTWPQLASAVTLGGAIVGDVARRVLLDQFHDSGRYCIDLDTLITDQPAAMSPADVHTVPEVPAALTQQEMRAIAKRIALPPAHTPCHLDHHRLHTLVEAATQAPSGGNNQPWQWLYYADALYLFRNPSKTGLLDIGSTASYLALGAATENLVLQAHALGLHVHVESLVAPQHQLAAVFRFAEDAHIFAETEAHECDPLATYIPLRTTNRTLGTRQPIQPEVLQHLQQVAHTMEGAELTCVTSDAGLAACGEIAAAAERLRLLNRRGHHDFVREIRWTAEEAQMTRDGLDLATIELTPAEQVGLHIARSWPVVAQVKAWGGGGAFEKLARKAIDAASCVGLLTMPQSSLRDFFNGGRALERVWLAATQHHLALQPIASAPFLFAHLHHAQESGFDEQAVQELRHLREQFVACFPIVETQHGAILLFRLAIADAPAVTSLRYPVEHVLTIEDDDADPRS